MPAASAFRLALVLCAGGVLWLAACTPPEPDAAGPAAESPSPAATAEATPAARFEGETIDVADIDAWLKDDWFRRETEGDAMKAWTLRRDGLQRMIDRRLLERAAEQAGVPPEELLHAEMNERISVSDEDVASFYEQNKERIGRDLADVLSQIRTHLGRQRAPEARAEYLSTLREGVELEVLLDAPRYDVAAIGPARGPEDAPITIIEFSDYQCPFCRRAEPTIDALLERYPEQVRLVYRHFPLDSIHPEARSAAEAAACAADQGRFWEFHGQLFAEGAKLDRESLEGYAEKAELDLEPFRACVAERRHRDAVQKDVDAGTQAGVTGTPAFFVNGIRLNGARPLEDFVQLVEDELSRSS